MLFVHLYVGRYVGTKLDLKTAFNLTHNIGGDELDIFRRQFNGNDNAGSGGGGRVRTVRIVQGDMVYGIYGSGNSSGIRLILGVFPRTAHITYGKFGKFDPIKGWYTKLHSKY